MISYDEKKLKNMLKHLNILYIEDENSIRENVTKALQLLVNKVFPLENNDTAGLILEENRIDLIISDINLPKKNGIDFIKEIRNKNYNIPVILLSAHTDKDYLLEATKLKLIDYLVKPIDFTILNEALLKTCQDILKEGKYIVNFQDNITYNVMHKKLYYNMNNSEIDLTAKEIELLDYFVENSTRVISHEEIKDEIWKGSFEVTDSALKNVLNKLRKKIGKDTIKNISGIGFRIHLN